MISGRIAACVVLSISGLASAEPLRFVVVGDTQTDGGHVSVNWDVLPLMVEDMNAHDPVLGLFVGDLVGGTGSVAGTVDQWEDFKLATGGFVGDLYVIPGNHDVYGGAGTFDAFASTFDWLPTHDSPAGEEGVSYYVDVGNVRFVGIASDQEVSNPYAVSAAGLDWLDRVLGESEAEHTFVYTHHPITFSDEDNMGGTAGQFWQTLLAHDVVGMFSGHWHRYQPSQPGAGGDTWETIIGTGGGYQPFSPIRPYQQMFGFLLVEVDGSEVTGIFYADADGDGFYDDEMDRFTMASSLPPREGVLAEYTFDDGTAADTAPLGRAIHGTLVGDATVVAGGVSGAAVQLDGAGDHVEAGAIDDYVLSINGDLTLSAWVKWDAFGSGTWADTILCYATNDYYTEDEETNYSYWLSLDGGRHLRGFWEYENGWNVNTVSTVEAPVSLGTWHHVAMVRDVTASAVRFYLDGEQLGDPVSFDRAPTGGGRGMLYLGSDTVDVLGGSELAGAIDEVCVFNTALDADAVGALHGLAPCGSLDLDPFVLGTSTMVRGGPVTLSVQGAPAGALVYFVGGGGVGSGPCPPILAGECLGLTVPLRVLGSVTADADGSGDVTVDLPVTAPATLSLQAVAFGGAAPALSEVRTVTVTGP